MRIRPISGGVEILAPAKLNLFLEVRGRRPDGYHEIETLMVTLDLCDRLTFEDDASGEIRLTCNEPALPVGDENLVVRAAKRLRAEAGGLRGARIVLEKAIPSEAGLGGGSSDAAATLAGLERLWGLSAGVEALDAIAGVIGADVAFFHHGPAAICRGRGEKVEPVSGSPTYHFVLVRPPFGLSTARVYQRVQLPAVPRVVDETLAGFASGDAEHLGRCLFNRLQPAAESLRPELARVRDALGNLAPQVCGALLCGSGSTYFGLCRDQTAALEVADHLESLGLGWIRVATCGSPAENAS